MIGTLRNWLVKIVGGNKDDGQFPTQVISYQGKNSEATTLTPYGLHANVGADTIGVLIPLGTPDVKGVLPLNSDARPQLGEGEVAFYHPDSGTMIRIKKSGDLEISAGNGKVSVSASQATVTADSVEVNGDTSIIGDLDVTGNLNTSGTTSLGSVVTSNGVNIGATHVHISGSPGNPTGPPQ